MMRFNNTGGKSKATKRPEFKFANTFSKHANHREYLVEINNTV